jgi:hypothetical protein
MAVGIPAFPMAPIEYDQKYQDQLNNILRQYFTQTSNPGQVAGSASDVGTARVAAGMTFNRPLGTTQIYSFATQADLANLRVGDVYVDTSASNVLKMKTS